jgi:signal peptidase I
MSPTFDPGDMIFIKLAAPEEIQIGDIITFVPNQKYDAYLTHRVVDIIPATDEDPIYFVTRGDHNNADDPPIDSRVLVGKYLFHVPKAGMAINLIRQNIIVMGITIVALFALTAVLRAFFSVKKEARRTRRES